MLQMQIKPKEVRRSHLPEGMNKTQDLATVSRFSSIQRGTYLQNGRWNAVLLRRLAVQKMVQITLFVLT